MKLLDKKSISELPATPGVYIFRNSQDLPVYIGKSVNIKDRVRSHIYAAKSDPKERRICESSSSVEFIQTAGELGALIRESILVKELSPLYNRKLRKLKNISALRLKVNELGYNTVSIEDVPSNLVNIEIHDFLMISASRWQLKSQLQRISEEYHLCDKLLGIENSKNACFKHMLKRCNGACAGVESHEHYNLRFSEAFAPFAISLWPFDGEIQIIERTDRMKETIRINNWCITSGSRLNNDLGRFAAIKRKFFDLDMYKITKSYLKAHTELTENLTYAI